eukprot:294320_1
MTSIFIFSLIYYLLPLIESTNLPFSWDKIPIFACIGSHDGFLTSNEVNKDSFNKFNQLIIWGFNVSCQNPSNGEIYPATISGSVYSCGINHTFYANMEQSLQYQAYELKENLINNNNLQVFGYIESTNVQESYVYQHKFNSNTPPFNTYHLKLSNIGVVNCYTDGCNWQGPTYRQYDHRQKQVRDYFVNSVVFNLINSTYLDGFFMDAISTWTNVLCPQWNCTEQEYNDLYNGSLVVASETVDLVHKMNKIVSISAHVDMYHLSDYYWKYREILNKYNGENTIRFYECLEGGWGSSFYNQFITLLNETRNGIAQHVHVCFKVMNPSWVSLAAYLIAMNNQSWFSYGGGWTVNNGWYQSEFNNSLGKPLDDANCINDNQWHIFNGINNIVFDLPIGGNSTDGMIIYIGKYINYEQCLDVVKLDNRFGSFTWINQNGDSYANMCYAQYGDAWMNIPQNNTISGHLGNLYCTRDFEYVSVQFDILNEVANISWKQ